VSGVDQPQLYKEPRDVMTAGTEMASTLTSCQNDLVRIPSSSTLVRSGYPMRLRP
jgi:hypothetical protein